jgi:carboxylesterase type B
MESGNFGYYHLGGYGYYQSIENSANHVDSVLKQMDCHNNSSSKNTSNQQQEKSCTVEDLKSLDTKELMKYTAMFSSPTFDTTVLPAELFTLYSEGKINPTDMIIGTNTYDDYLILGVGIALSQEDFIQLANKGITESFMWNDTGIDINDKEKTQAAIEQYSPNKYNGSMVAAFAQFEADVHFVCPSRDLAETAAKNIDGSVYSYVFGHLSEYDPVETNNLLQMANITDTTWATHMAELPFVFGNNVLMNGTESVPFSDDDKHLSQEMMSRWANFAKNGNPYASNYKLKHEEQPAVWQPVTASSYYGETDEAADPSYLRFMGNGSTMISSDQNKAEQCSAIYPSPSYYQDNKNSDSKSMHTNSSGSSITTIKGSNVAALLTVIIAVLGSIFA